MERMKGKSMENDVDAMKYHCPECGNPCKPYMDDRLCDACFSVMRKRLLDGHDRK